VTPQADWAGTEAKRHADGYQGLGGTPQYVRHARVLATFLCSGLIGVLRFGSICTLHVGTIIAARA
jgi:hypothetical protein